MDIMTTGRRVARARKRMGWTQQQLAARLGYSVSWVSQVERGAIPLDRISILDRLAEVLNIELVELTGQPYRHGAPGQDSGHAGIPALRLVLQRATMPTYGGLADQAPRASAELRAAVEHVEQLRQDAKFDQLGVVLPALVDDVAVARREATQGPDHDELATLFVRVCHVARVTADLTGHHDLAWTAVELEVRAAAELAAPAPVAAAAWDLCGVWLHAGGDALQSARAVALDALDRLDAYVGHDAELTSLWGAMHLRAAVASSRLWNETDVRDHLAEAARVAPASGNAWQTQFNGPNVAVHALETAVELGRPSDALGLADGVPIESIASTERRTHFWTCRARGLQMAGRVAPAIDAILTAERLAPQHVYNRPMARELVTDLLHRGRRPASEVRRLARRMGLTT